MEQEDLIRRLKGLGKGTPPPGPDFTQATTPLLGVTPVAARSSRMGIAPIAAIVAVLALATAALALPKGGPLRQVLASDDTTETTEVESETESAPVPHPCDQATPPGIEEQAEGEGEAVTEEQRVEREQKAQAWAEWRAENCSGSNVATADEDDSDDSEAKDGNKGEGRENSARDEACTGPPPHANNPENADPARTAAQREAEKREWQEWHRENCTSADGSQPPGEKANANGQGNGHQKAGGEGHGPNDSRHEGRPSAVNDGDDDTSEEGDQV